MVSSPSYDSNVYTASYTTNTEKVLREKQKEQWGLKDYAFNTNRFNTAYAPGSVIKLVTASIGLENGLDPNNLPIITKAFSGQIYDEITI